MEKVLAIRHVKIENLGVLERILKELSYDFVYLDTPKGERVKDSLENYSGIIVLGGYMGAYEEDKYPYLSYEFELMEEALKKKIPLLGICLGAQMLAKVLGAKVFPGEKGKEIGWMKVFKEEEHPFFEKFPKTIKVFQWHGDTFELPYRAKRVFSSEKYENQGFIYENMVGFQFHLEVDKELALLWKESYYQEIREENIDPQVFENIKKEEIKFLEDLAKDFLKRWLGKV